MFVSTSLAPSPSLPSEHPAPNRPPDRVVTQKMTAVQGALYRAASGDLNLLHIDPEVARKEGFPAPILTGTCMLGMGTGHVLEIVGVDKRLSKPVFPDDEVRTEMWVEDRGRKVVYRPCMWDRVVMDDAAVEWEDEEERRAKL
jgi:peroxisomal enoyl-CoA hydratase 2